MDTVQQCIERLLFLERRLGAKVKYRLFDASGLDVDTIHGLQQAAREIAVFLGIPGVTFIVTIAKQKPGVGGHIELKDGQKQVFVEISSELTPFPEAVLATLAHEITHKYLYIHRIELPDELENEELTDTAAIFLGLGRLLVNGACYEKTTQHFGPQGIRTVTKSGSVGYLGKYPMALTYFLVCSMRRIPASVYELGLSPIALDAVRQYADQDWGIIHDHPVDLNMVVRTTKQLQCALHPYRMQLAQADRDLRYVQVRYFQAMQTISKKVHRQLHALLNDMKVAEQLREPDPCVRYLELLRMERDAKALLDDQEEIRHLQNILSNLASTLDAMNGGPPFPQCDASEVVCPRDGTPIACAPGVRAVRCPVCQYEFVADARARELTARPEVRAEATSARKSQGNILEWVEDALWRLWRLI